LSIQKIAAENQNASLLCQTVAHFDKLLIVFFKFNPKVIKMKYSLRFVMLLAVTFLLFSKAAALPVRIVSGELFVGGTSYGTPGYQTYQRYFLIGKMRMPQKEFRMAAEQIDNTFLGHPAQPDGEFVYHVKMPPHGLPLYINNRLFSPVWLAGCVWNIRSSAQIIVGTPESPQFMIVNAPFTMDGSTEFYGAYTSGFRIKGQGTAELKFEKQGTKYYILEARYTFTDNSVLDQNSK
jgi:hypothetical protein